MIFIGIDPGASGGICVLDEKGKIIALDAMPKTERDVADFISEFASESCAVIEAVHSMPGQGVASSFKFGMSYGGLRMALIAARIPFTAATPTTWQREFGLTGKKHSTKTAKKNGNKARAQELFPGVKITHAIADALLIAEYARRNL